MRVLLLLQSGEREGGSNEIVGRVVDLNRNRRIESKMKLESLRERGFEVHPSFLLLLLLLLRSTVQQRVRIDRLRTVDERVEGVEGAFHCIVDSRKGP